MKLRRKMVQRNIFSLLFLFTLGSILFTSCKKNTDNAAPEITRVRPMDAQYADSSMASAKPGTLIVIEGKNLGDVQQIFFNGYPAAFESVYNTNTNIIVRIPGDVPVLNVNPDDFNMIQVITRLGTALFRFVVQPPAPVLGLAYNENPAAGEIMIIAGKYLSPVTEVILPGGKIANDFEVDEEGTQLKVTAPGGITEAGYLMVRTPFDSAKTDYYVNNFKGPGVFANFNAPGDASFGWGFWGAIKTDAPSLYPQADGAYIQSKFKNLGAWDFGWWADNRNIAILNSTKVVAPVAELGKAPVDYYLKFEINTRVPIRQGVIFGIVFGADPPIIANLEYHPNEELGEDGVLDTHNKWMTVRIPLSRFKKPTLGTLFKDGKIGSFHVGIYSGADPVPDFDAAFDNFRVEKVSNQ